MTWRFGVGLIMLQSMAGASLAMVDFLNEECGGRIVVSN
jgi:hypothetical protein